MPLRARTPLLALLACVGLAQAATYEVGAGQPFATLAALPALVAGDVVEIGPGTYHEVRKWTASGTVGSPITIRGLGATRPVIDATGLTVDGAGPNPRAVFQIEGSNVVVEHLEFTNARNGNNGSGVRVTGAGISGITVRDCRLDGNDMGIQADGHDGLLVDGCEIDHNGTAAFSGFSHNIYVGGGRVTFRGCFIHDALFGQNVKTRAHFVALLYNRIADAQDGEVGMVDSAETTTANSNAVMIGNVVVSKVRGSGWNSARFVLFGAESGFTHNGTLYAFNNTFIAAAPTNIFLNATTPEAAIVARSNIMVGSGRIADTTVGAVSGSGNWMPMGATVPSGFTGLLGSDPGFVAAFTDLHLIASSTARSLGTASATFVDGDGVSRSGTPTSMYDDLGSLSARADTGGLDAGAYAFSSGTTGGGGGGSGGGGSAGTVTVALTTPGVGTTFTAPATISLVAAATDSAGAVTSVTFSHESTTIATTTTSPFSDTWTAVPAGTYVLTARATGPSGTATSSSVSITVNAAPGGPTASPPTSGVAGSNGSGGCGLGGAVALIAGMMTLMGMRVVRRD
jgi:hypothetical protein